MNCYRRFEITSKTKEFAHTISHNIIQYFHGFPTSGTELQGVSLKFSPQASDVLAPFTQSDLSTQICYYPH
ncbi:hypothetical protein A0H81_02938 [Grifola frondosa]|uniref:Uncharacterized protein n=1 Tax=Grifola frondosa TaxID=5627 RepID=A0A1C7MH85_GRIFR|nr:hypothetical protein A0H81_02938 [Grifola frondosa]